MPGLVLGADFDFIFCTHCWLLAMTTTSATTTTRSSSAAAVAATTTTTTTASTIKTTLLFYRWLSSAFTCCDFLRFQIQILHHRCAAQSPESIILVRTYLVLLISTQTQRDTHKHTDTHKDTN